MRNASIRLLRAGCGDTTVNFRDGQFDAIEHVVEGRGRLLVVQRTGWGKSFVYFIATKLLRDCGHGPAVLVSPLIALMRNQISAAQRMGVRAATINSDNVNEWANVEERIQNDDVDILRISPERLGNQRFVSGVFGPIAERIGLLVIDEAHCISDWGHDFRPHYRLISRIIGNLPSNVRLLATTATANNRVVKDLQTVLGPSLFIVRGDLSRPSLFLQNIHLTSQAERMAWIADHLADLPGSGIIYTLTIRDAEQLAGWLKSRNLKVEAYTSETGERREEFERALLENRLKALVATMALGMGFDKPDLAFVIHYQTPGSVVAYYQQVGRAGQEYAAMREGLMEFLIQALDGETGTVDSHLLPALPELLSPRLVQAANTFLRRSYLPIKPRAMWQAGGLGNLQVTGKIAEAFRAEEGRILCLWADAGWGELARNGKQVSGRFSDELVDGTVSMVREWNPQPAPTWLTFVPSFRHKSLVLDFARRVSDRLGLRFVEALRKVQENQEQKLMRNSTQQARNVDGVFEVIAGTVFSDPLLLVDDMVDSGWTLTVAIYQLRKAGSGSAYPLALASTSNQ